MKKRRWTTQDIYEAKRLWDSHKSLSVIGRQLNRTPAAVYNVLWRIKTGRLTIKVVDDKPIVEAGEKPKNAVIYATPDTKQTFTVSFPYPVSLTGTVVYGNTVTVEVQKK